MSVEIEIPACGFSEPRWEKLLNPEKALLIAIQEIRFHQEPDRAEAMSRVAEMLRKAGGRPGLPWSAAFVAWCLGAAEVHPQVFYPASPLSWIEWANRTGRIRKSSPKRGDLYFIDRPGKCHLGFVAKPGVNKLTALEGNVYEDGRLEGPMATLVTRPKHEIDGFISLNSPSLSHAKVLLAA